MHHELEAIRKLRGKLMQIDNLEQLDQFVGVYGINLFNRPLPSKEKDKSPGARKGHRTSRNGVLMD